MLNMAEILKEFMLAGKTEVNLAADSTNLVAM